MVQSTVFSNVEKSITKIKGPVMSPHKMSNLMTRDLRQKIMTTHRLTASNLQWAIFKPNFFTSCPAQVDEVEVAPMD